MCLCATSGALLSYSWGASQLHMKWFELQLVCFGATDEVILSYNRGGGASRLQRRCFRATADVIMIFRGGASEVQLRCSVGAFSWMQWGGDASYGATAAVRLSYS